MVPSVYVIEGDEYLRIAIGEYLNTQGYLVSIFETGDKALKHLLKSEKENFPKMIVLDIEMADAFSFFEKISSKDFSMPFYIIYKNKENLKKLESEKIVFGNSPINLKEMSDIINNRLHQNVSNKV